MRWQPLLLSGMSGLLIQLCRVEGNVTRTPTVYYNTHDPHVTAASLCAVQSNELATRPDSGVVPLGFYHTDVIGIFIKGKWIRRSKRNKELIPHDNIHFLIRPSFEVSTGIKICSGSTICETLMAHGIDNGRRPHGISATSNIMTI